MEVDTFSDDNDSLPETKPKRKVKTPSQIVGLERLYEEHKYPSESLKTELAESLGLTEKQVSGWFCHRRLKDKKLKDDPNTHGKQERSSGVIQDRGSGLRQDSCGSTKQGEHRHSEPKEVESRRFTGEKVPGTWDITCEPVNHVQNDSGTDDTSSESSFPLQNNYFPQSTEPHCIATSIDIDRKRNSKAVDIEGLKVRTKPSGYLKVKVQAEHVAITSVKRQLGRHYKEDGPPLGIDFDPLPPGAFESPTRDAVEEPGLVCESTPFPSYNSMTCKQRHPGRGYEEYISRVASRISDLDKTSFQVMHKSNIRENYMDMQFEKKPTLSYERNSAGKMYSSMEMNEDYSAREAPRDIRDSKEMRAKHHGRINEFDSSRRIKESASSDRVPTYGKRLDRRQSKPSDSGDVGDKFTLNKSSESRPSNFPVKKSFFSLEEKKASRQATKESDAYGKRTQFDGYNDPVEVSAFPANETRPAKRSREDLPKQGYAVKPLMDVAPPWNPPRRSLAEVPSSFSEDETGETSTSGD